MQIKIDKELEDLMNQIPDPTSEDLTTTYGKNPQRAWVIKKGLYEVYGNSERVEICAYRNSFSETHLWVGIQYHPTVGIDVKIEKQKEFLVNKDLTENVLEEDMRNLTKNILSFVISFYNKNREEMKSKSKETSEKQVREIKKMLGI